MRQAVRQEGKFKNSLFSFSVPNSNRSVFGEPMSPSIIPKGYGWDNYQTPYPESRWKDFGFLRRNYRFWGPWGVGDVSTMNCGGGVSRPCEPKAGVSFFHPRAFELAVIDYIHDELTSRPEGWYEGGANPCHVYRAPINWQPLNHLPGPSAYFEVDTGPDSKYNHYFVTAIDDTDLLSIAFQLDPEQSGPKHIPPEEWVDQKNIKQLMFDIFNSLEIHLSPDVEAKRLKAIEGLQDASLKKTMQVQNLTYQPPEEMGKKIASGHTEW
jgi:hypothetical protein